MLTNQILKAQQEEFRRNNQKTKQVIKEAVSREMSSLREELAKTKTTIFK